MQPPDKPEDEAARLAALHRLDVLDTPPEDRFDRITRIARHLFDVPIALISLVDGDRQWFKSRAGLDACETPRDISFCGHAILGEDILLVRDAQADARFVDNPLVTGEPNIRFYAGYPLRGPGGQMLGTLCLIDHVPRDLDAETRSLLIDLGHVVEHELAAFHLATMDELTQIANRRGFEALGRQALQFCQRTGSSASLLFFDLDRFKEINDRFGHAAGDRALRDFARLLRETFRESDVIGRISGDEFVVLFTNVNPSDVDIALRRFQATVDDYNARGRPGLVLRYSVGGAEFHPQQHADIGDLIDAADRLMYRQKRAGR
jgi:diguanylate cyclase (GGDEF)-like protein